MTISNYSNKTMQYEITFLMVYAITGTNPYIADLAISTFVSARSLILH